MEVAELQALYASVASSGAPHRGTTYCEAYAANENLRFASSQVAATEKKLAAAKAKAGTAAQEDVADALEWVAIYEKRLAEAQQWLDRAATRAGSAFSAWREVAPADAEAEADRLMGHGSPTAN